MADAGGTPRYPVATYNPNYYEVKDFEHAKHVTVGDMGFDDGTVVTCEERWDAETIYTVELIRDLLPLSSSSLVLDYGCGTGRIAKGLIGACGCSVDGTDASASMLVVAGRHVANGRFRTVDIANIGRYDAVSYSFAVCTWVLQHAYRPWNDISRLYAALEPGGLLLVVNECGRHVPTTEYGFAEDRVDVPAFLIARFGQPVKTGRLDPGRVSPKYSERSFWAVYQRPLGVSGSHDGIQGSL